MAPCSMPPAPPTSSLASHMLAHYLAVPGVRDWLLNRNAAPSANSLPLRTAFSYACMYYSPATAPRTPPPYALPEPYLDFGDVLLWQHVYDGIAVGNLYNKKERHALAHVRDSVLHSTRLSSRPCTRNFAADLRVDHLEIVEFAWMSDDSLIIACRRLHKPAAAHHNRLVLSCDLICYDVLPSAQQSLLSSPLLTIVLRERATVCQFCGVRGIEQCACPPSFKSRAPAHAERTSFAYRSASSQLSLHPPPNSERLIEAWLAFCKRLFTFAQSGSFFVEMYRHTHDARTKLFYSPLHPVPYQFVCGDRSETLQLLSLYVRRVRLCQKLLMAEARLQGAQQQLLQYDGSAERGGIDKASNARHTQQDRRVPAHYGASHASYAPRDTQHGVVPYVVEQQFLMQLEHDVLLGRLSDDGSSPSPSTTVTGNSRTSSVHDGGGGTAVNSADADVSSALLAALTARSDGAAAGGVPTAVAAASSVAGVDAHLAVWNGSGGGGANGDGALQTGAAEQRNGNAHTDTEVRRYITCDAQNVPACRKCGHRFQKRGNLIRHIQAVHLKLKPFMCTLCSARFGYKTHLKRHQQKHQRAALDDVARFQVRA
eukprot:TRINITY_DN40553_c0_g1_i1.p1 TRINITY_DN40553_c0_g1~~TRINITY_DN40553_c0_g1_i1.p1  ORF type:complete len:641 (+),score=114.61 TRINITY_DN40553_c0_g1_i1:131-1924(+)